MGPDLIAQHCAHLVRLNRAAGTVDQRRYALRRFERFIGHGAIDATLEELRAFADRATTGGRGRAAEYRASELTHLIGFYRWALREGILIVDPTVRLERPQRKKGRPRPMPDHLVTFALDAAPRPMRTWYWIAAYAGLRACEVATLRGEDYWGERRLVVREGKGGKYRRVPVPAVLRPELAHLPRAGVWFPHGDMPESPITAGQLQRRGNRWLHDHDVEQTFHQFRHWYGTTLRRRGVPIDVIRDLMGHASLSTTEIYTQVDDDELDLAVEVLSAPGEAVA